MQKRMLTLAISAGLLSLANAQDKTTDNAVAELDTVLVESVYAVPAERDNTGSSVTILTEADFKDRNATYVVDALKTVPGIAVGATGNRGAQTSVFLRGGESDHVLVVVDGVKVNPANGNGVDFGTLPLNNVERIEVLRGEQSALWGSHAIGGVINITTKSGKYADKPFNAEVNLGAGSEKAVDFSTTLYGRNEGLYYAINANHSRTDGISAKSKDKFTYYSKKGSKITTGGWQEDDAFERTGASLRVGYEFAEAGVEAFYQHSKNTVHFDPSQLDKETAIDNNTVNKQDMFKLGGYLGSDDSLIKQSAYVSLIKQDSETKDQYPRDSKGKSVNIGYQIDYNFDTDGETTQAVSGLLEYKKDSYSSNNYKKEKAIKEKSVALEYRLFNENDHALSLGVRHDKHSKTKDSTTYKLAGGYRVNDNFRLHGSVGTGVKTPSIFDYYGWNAQYIGNPNLKAEESRGGEIGVTIESADKNHVFDATYFNRHVDDFISAKSEGQWPNQTSQAINLDGTTKISGLELSYNGQITDSLSAYANYSYTKTEDSKGKQLQRRPEHQANIGVNYQITDAFSTTANVNYVGKRLNSYYDSATFSSLDVDMPSYTLVNLGASYKINKHFETYLNVNNVFDKAYENVIGYGQPGRNFYLGIKGSW